MAKRSFNLFSAAMLGFAVLLNVNTQLFAQSSCDKVDKIAEEIEKAKAKEDKDKIFQDKRRQTLWDENKLDILEAEAAKGALEKALADDAQATEKISPELREKIKNRIKVLDKKLAFLKNKRDRLLIEAGVANQKLSLNCRPIGSSSSSSSSSAGYIGSIA